MLAGIPVPVWREQHLRAATRAAGVALWSWNVDTDAIAMDEMAYDLWDVPKVVQNLSFEVLSQNIHPADLERVSSAFSATRAVLGSYEIDFRVLVGSDIRWISARGQGGDADITDRIMFGIFLDVTQRKQAEESSDLLAGEMSHRVKNLLQLATNLTEMTSRSAITKEDMVRELTHRLTALGRAHNLVRPEPGQQSEGRFSVTCFQFSWPRMTKVMPAFGYGSLCPKSVSEKHRAHRSPSSSMNWRRIRQNMVRCRQPAARWMSHATPTTMTQSL